jgi:ketosteroid isomerase-like protein
MLRVPRRAVGEAFVESWELLARESLRDLVARYNSAGDAGRLDAMMALFCEDAVLEIDGREQCGVGAIRETFAEAARSTEAGHARFIRHFTATHQIDVEDPTRARGRCYFQTLTERGLDHWGRYVDVYRCEDGRWRFARRRVVLEGFVPGGWADRTQARLRES